MAIPYKFRGRELRKKVKGTCQKCKRSSAALYPQYKKMVCVDCFDFDAYKKRPIAWVRCTNKLGKKRGSKKKVMV